MGCCEASLGDTSGTGTAGKTQHLITTVAEAVPVPELAGHFHDTYGQSFVNVYAAMELGVATFDSSVAVLGGCPYAKCATAYITNDDPPSPLHGLHLHTSAATTP